MIAEISLRDMGGKTIASWRSDSNAGLEAGGLAGVIYEHMQAEGPVPRMSHNLAVKYRAWLLNEKT
jgi:hypothetical protein